MAERGRTMNDPIADKRARLAELLRKRANGGEPAPKAALASVKTAAGAKPAAPAVRGLAFPKEYPTMKAIFEDRSGGGIGDLLYLESEGINADSTVIAGQSLINFSSYNYIGMSGDPTVSAAAKAAIDRYGTSVSASRLVSGQRSIHTELEDELASLIGAEAALVFVGGYSTNATVIGHLMGPGDLIFLDSLIHASVHSGAGLSGARIVTYPHNNLDALETLLERRRAEGRQALIVTEGVFSMDGDIPDLTRLVALKERFGAALMMDEAHSIGVLGATGRGIGEHFGVPASAVDIWMGTLSKAFASCGGYIAGSRELIGYLRHTAPGFVYSVGLSPADTGAALAAVRKLKAEPQRVETLRQRSALFLALCRENGLDTGESHDSAVIPVMVGDLSRAVRLSRAMKENGILALPIGYPAVAQNAARLRFFISSTHSEAQIRETVQTLVACLKALD